MVESRWGIAGGFGVWVGVWFKGCLKVMGGEWRDGWLGLPDMYFLEVAGFEAVLTS